MQINLDKQIASLKGVYIDYGRYAQLKDQWLRSAPAMYIPDWKFLNREHLEIIVIDFLTIFHSKNGIAVQREAAGSKKFDLPDVFDFMCQVDQAMNTIPTPGLFYAGVLAYDLYAQTEPVKANSDFYQLPDFYILTPANALVVNHTRQTILLVSTNSPGLPVKLENKPDHSVPSAALTVSESKQDYLAKIKKVRELIYQGEVYQINYTIRLEQPFPGSSWRFFRKLYELNPAPFSVFIQMPHCHIISNTPERFVAQKGDHVFTEPIKGTIKRGRSVQEDKEKAQQLRVSSKDAAELSMIVDLLRNDLSKVCRPGSVQVVQHKRLETFTNVHHLVSTIEGQLENEICFAELFRAVFPGGSISGCPKIAALKYIRQLEPHNRSFYSGSFFLRFPEQNQMDSNILIRTAIYENETLYFQVGGGIVSDSEPEAEYDECLAKADSFVKVAEGLKHFEEKS